MFQKHTNHFKMFTRGRHKIPYNNFSEDPFELEFSALGQHNGLATRLLDWVHSPYVAAFFGFSEIIESATNIAIFILSLEIVSDMKTENNNHIKIYSPLTHDNKRLISQQGVFTYMPELSLDRYLSIEDFINNHPADINDEVLLFKIILPISERDVALDELNLMNINNATLFPDLIGASEYCNYLLCKKPK